MLTTATAGHVAERGHGAGPPAEAGEGGQGAGGDGYGERGAEVDDAGRIQLLFDHLRLAYAVGTGR